MKNPRQGRGSAPAEAGNIVDLTITTFRNSALKSSENTRFAKALMNWTTGRLDPGCRAIMKRTGLAKSTVAKALAKLKALGIIWWERRSAHAFDENGMYVLKQITNAYALLPPSQWPGYVDLVLEEAVNRAPWPEATGSTPPMPDVHAQAMTAVADGASVERLASLLDADPGDELARSLASFGRTVAARRA